MWIEKSHLECQKEKLGDHEFFFKFVKEKGNWFVESFSWIFKAKNVPDEFRNETVSLNN